MQSETTSGVRSVEPAGIPEGMGPPPPIPPYPHATEFSVITIGTGNPQPSLQRASAGTMVQYRGKYYVVDIGSGAQTSFLRGEKGTYAFKDIAALCFTHFHQDHANDYFDLMTNRWLTGGKEITVVGPPGAKKLHRFFTEFFRDDLGYRLLREVSRGVTTAGVFTDVTIKEIKGSERFRLRDLQVTTAELTHTMYNLGYRFEGSGKAVVVSGDTSYDERLITLAKDADMLVMDGDERWAGVPRHELAPLSSLARRYRPRSRYGGNFGVIPHASMDEIAKMAAAAKVKHLVMTHFRAGPVDEEAVRAALHEGGFQGAVTFATDGMEIPV